jgi:hypothetical protein
MIIRHYDDDMTGDDVVFEEKRKKMNQFKEKRHTQAISLNKLPIQNDQEAK